MGGGCPEVCLVLREEVRERGCLKVVGRGSDVKGGGVVEPIYLGTGGRAGGRGCPEVVDLGKCENRVEVVEQICPARGEEEGGQRCLA